METANFWPQRILSPIWVSVREAGTSDTPDCIYDKAARYEQDVCRALQEFQSLPGNDFMSRLSMPEDPEMEAAIRGKIQDAQIRAYAIGESLYASLELGLSASLTEEELDALTDQLEEQYQNGLGAEFELLCILTAEGEDLAVRLGNSELYLFPSDTVPEEIGFQEHGQTM